MALKHGAVDCWKCGVLASEHGEMTGTGQCIDCAQADLVDNMVGLTIPGSVPWKRWEAAYAISHPGRPKIITPTAEFLANLPADVFTRIRSRIA